MLACHKTGCQDGSVCLMYEFSPGLSGTSGTPGARRAARIEATGHDQEFFYAKI